MIEGRGQEATVINGDPVMKQLSARWHGAHGATSSVVMLSSCRPLLWTPQNVYPARPDQPQGRGE